MIRRPPRSTLFPTRRSSDLSGAGAGEVPGFESALGLLPPLVSRGGASVLSIPVMHSFFDAYSEKRRDRKSTRLNSSHQIISYAVFCLKKKNTRRKEEAYNEK